MHTLADGFGKLALEEVIATVHPANTTSIRVLQKSGMQWIADREEDGLPVKVFHAINPAMTLPVTHNAV